MGRAATLALAAGLFVAVPAFAQNPPAGATQPDAAAKVATAAQPTPADRVIEEMVQMGRLAVEKILRPFQTRIGPGQRQLVAAYLIAINSERPGYAKLLSALEAARLDKQIGAAPKTDATTSVAMKGLAPKILGVAVESGAVTKEVSDSTLTFRATPIGVVKALQGKGLIDIAEDYEQNPLAKFAAGISLSASFDVSRGSEANVFTADEEQLSAWSARLVLVNQRDSADPQYRERWGELLSSKFDPYRHGVLNLNDALERWPEYRKWEGQLEGDVNVKVDQPLQKDNNVEAAAKAYRSILVARLAELAKLKQPQEVTVAVDTYVAQLALVQDVIEDIYAFVGRGTLATFDWTTTRETTLPDLYVATGVFETGLGALRKTELTVNGALSLYRSIPNGASHRLKTVDLTAEIERPLGPTRVLPAATLTLALRYSYLPHDTVAGAATTPTTAAPAGAAIGVATAPKGSIGVLQAKVTIPVKDSGLKVPLSITVANRTEVIKEKEVRGNVGVTVDLDVVVNALSGLVK